MIESALCSGGRDGGLVPPTPPPRAEESLSRLRNRLAGLRGLGLPRSSASESPSGESAIVSVPRGFLSVNGVVA